MGFFSSSRVPYYSAIVLLYVAIFDNIYSA